MTSDWIWETLGTDPTPDQRTIRAAYAQRLRLTHPEDDPEGFKSLRAAYESALAQDQGRADESLMNAPGRENPPGGAAAESKATPPASPEELRPDIVRHNALTGEFFTAFNDKAVPPDELQKRLRDIVAAPTMQNLAIHDQTERWLAMLLSAPHPAADTLVEIAAEAFQWEGDGVRLVPIYARPALAQAADARFVRERAKAGGRPGRAWRAISTGIPGWRDRLATMTDARLPEDVEALLDYIERHHPRLLEDGRLPGLARWRQRLNTPQPGARGLRLAAFTGPSVAAYAHKFAHDPLPVWAWCALALAISVAVYGPEMRFVTSPNVMTRLNQARRTWSRHFNYSRYYQRAAPVLWFAIALSPAKYAWAIGLAPMAGLIGGIGPLAAVTLLRMLGGGLKLNRVLNNLKHVTAASALFAIVGFLNMLALTPAELSEVGFNANP